MGTDDMLKSFNQVYVAVSKYGFFGIMAILMITVDKWLPAIGKLYGTGFRTLRNNPVELTKQSHAMTMEEHQELCDRAGKIWMKELGPLQVEISNLKEQVRNQGDKIDALGQEIGDLKNLLIQKLA